MKYIVIGLGRFGSKLASNLTEMGHEVIGVDNHHQRLDELKDLVTSVMKMDSTNINAIKSLPLDEVDAVIVAIGEDIGSSLLTLSVIKNLNVKRIIGRAVSRMHYDIIKQMGIEEVILPLEESAKHVAYMLQFKSTAKFMEITDDYAVAELVIPPKYFGHTLNTINIKERFDLRLIAIKKPPEENIITTIFRTNHKLIIDFDMDQALGEKDILVVAGKFTGIKRFIES
jgi:trk system potassium uptake protein TrkA